MNSVLDFYLRKIVRRGDLRLTAPDGTVAHYGDGSGETAHLRINSRTAERQIALNPGLRFGECYMSGEVDVLEGDIYSVLELILSNAGIAVSSQPWMKAIDRARLLLRRFAQFNTASRAKRNVHHHYDLSGELYDLFLDSDRQYSCAYFETPEDDLETAQLAKKRHVAAKLLLDRPELKTLDIGCGWGGLALYLAEHASANVTGVTLSEEQLGVARRRAKQSGFEDRVRFELQDYRKVEGPFDRIVSVGMFEHVGPDYYDDYFLQAERLLRDDGVMLLHTIGCWGVPTNTNAFIGKYIFPGGYLPALSQIMASVQRAGLVVTDVEVLRLHYAETLKAWRSRFAAKREAARVLYDERFCRMWEFYLAASECSFRYQDYCVFQLQLAKRVDTLPITRGYMAEAEDMLRAKDRGRIGNKARTPA